MFGIAGSMILDMFVDIEPVGQRVVIFVGLFELLLGFRESV